MRQAAVAWGTIKGGRESQQDAANWVEWKKGKYLLVLADGIGGAAGGDVASETAVAGFAESFMKNPTAAVRSRLLAALEDANDAVCDKKRQVPALASMGTTLVGAAIVEAKLAWVSVGDSPLWLIRNGAIDRLNENHSIGGLLDMRAKAGEITAEEATNSRQRGVLLEAVQGEDMQYVDAPLEALDLLPGDTVIAASDGVETCSGEELCDIVTAGRPSATDIVGAILDAVAEHEWPGQDNATLIVYRPR